MSSMQVVRFFPPGGPERLEYISEPKPQAPKAGEVLIKVRATALIWPELYWPIYQKSDGSYTSTIPCRDFAGVIAEVGDDVTDPELAVGREVYAFTSRRNHEGALAEYAKADIDQVLPLPKGLSFTDAASIPLSALTAWQALFDHGKLEKGQTVLITGIGGGTGIFAAQFAKRVGARVLGSGGSRTSRALATRFGVDEFIDYKTTTLQKAAKDVDLVLDCVGGKAQEEALGVVKSGGLFISIVQPNITETAKEHGVRAMFFIVSMNASQLRNITKLLEEGTVRTVVDKTFPLERAREAYEEGAQGHIHGKIVIEVAR